MSPRSKARMGAALGLLAALVFAACSADPLNIVLLAARAPGDKCDFPDDTKYVTRGSLDLRPYVSDPNAVPPVVAVSAGYGQAFSWENNLSANPISVNGQLVDPGTGNDFIADSVVYSYQYSDPSVTLADEMENIHGVIPAGGKSTDNFIGVGLIQPKAFAAIDSSTAIDSSAQTLLVTFQIFGKTTAGRTNHTNQVTFPLTIYSSSTTPLDCSKVPLADGGTVVEVLNGGVCNVPGRDQDVSCKTTQ